MMNVEGSGVEVREKIVPEIIGSPGAAAKEMKNEDPSKLDNDILVGRTRAVLKTVEVESSKRRMNVSKVFPLTEGPVKPSLARATTANRSSMSGGEGSDSLLPIWISGAPVVEAE